MLTSPFLENTLCLHDMTVIIELLTTVQGLYGQQHGSVDDSIHLCLYFFGVISDALAFHLTPSAMVSLIQ